MLHQEGDVKVCPYNPSHLIRPKRMITHLAKCRKNYISLGFKICPMDATHHIPPEQYEEHLEKCPKRAVVDAVMCAPEVTPANPILSQEKVAALMVPTEENWDEVNEAPTYDPLANAAGRNVMRFLKNAPPAERKAFQHAERLRLIELQEKEAAQGPLRNVGRQLDKDSVRLPAQPSQAFVHAQQSRR